MSTGIDDDFDHEEIDLGASLLDHEEPNIITDSSTTIHPNENVNDVDGLNDMPASVSASTSAFASEPTHAHAHSPMSMPSETNSTSPGLSSGAPGQTIRIQFRGGPNVRPTVSINNNSNIPRRDSDGANVNANTNENENLIMNASGGPSIRIGGSVNNQQRPNERIHPTGVHMGTTNININGPSIGLGNNQRNAPQGQQQQQQQQRPNSSAVQYPGRLGLNQRFARFPTDVQIQLTPLTEQPTNSEKGTKQNQKPIPELECAICMEYIDMPSHCGSCTARFCRQCLTRAAMQSHVCPGCRKAIPTPGDILSDAKFYEELAIKRSDLNLTTKNNGGGGGGISCPNLNCMQKVQPCNLRRHIKECEYTHVACKYASFGCKWTGPRRDVKDHYKIGCHIDKVSPLVENVRQLRASHQAHASMMERRFQMERQAMIRMNHQNYLLQVKDRENWVHMMQMIYTSMCSPKFFLQRAIVWRDFWNCLGVRAMSDNFICLLPIALWIVKHSLMGCKYLSRLFIPQNDQELQLALWDEVIMATCTTMLGVLFFICFVSIMIIFVLLI